MVYNAASAYQKTTVATASPAELTLMLYEGAIKFCNKALIGFEKKDYSIINENLIKAQRIINEFRVTLDHKYPVAKEFEQVYDYIHYQLVQANIKKDVTMLEEALQYTREMRDTWKEVMVLNRQSVQ